MNSIKFFIQFPKAKVSRFFPLNIKDLCSDRLLVLVIAEAQKQRQAAIVTIPNSHLNCFNTLLLLLKQFSEDLKIWKFFLTPHFSLLPLLSIRHLRTRTHIQSNLKNHYVCSGKSVGSIFKRGS